MPGSKLEDLLLPTAWTRRTELVDDEVVREAASDLRVHHTGIDVDVPGEAPIDHHRDRIQGASAL